jgi:hypothetical protein
LTPVLFKKSKVKLLFFFFSQSSSQNSRKPFFFLNNLTFNLITTLTALLRPREMRHRDDEEAVARVHDTCQSIVPSEKRGQDGKEAASFDDAGGGFAGRVLDQITDSKQQKGQV